MQTVESFTTKIMRRLVLTNLLTFLLGGCINQVSYKEKAESSLTLSYSSSSYSFAIQRAGTTGVPVNSLNTSFQSCTSTPPLPAGLILNPSTCEISGTPTTETNATYEIVAVVSDKVASVSLSMITHQLVPEISYSSNPFLFNLFETATLGLPLNSGGPIVSCAISPTLPLGLSLNTSTCEISGAALVLSGTSNYNVTATNSSGNSFPYSLSLGVANVVPDIAYSAASYVFNLNDAATTSVPDNYGGGITSCAVAPPLPAGLSISQTTCLISGTPNAVTAQTTYSVTPSNIIGPGSSVDVDLTINNVVPALAYSAGTYNFNLNTASSTGVPVNSGGAITSCAVNNPLPTGLSLSATTCRISGTPTAVTANATYLITPSNAVGAGLPVGLDLRVSNVVPNITYVGSPFSFNLYAAGSTTGAPTNTGGSITGCIVSPALPAGLTINAATCAISGTPTALRAASNFTVTPSNAVGSGTPTTVSLAVANVVPAITYSSGVYNFNLNASSDSGLPTNAGGAITGCSVNPALPTGLSLSPSTCRISGTPIVLAATDTYDITASNAVGDAVLVSLDITVNNVAPSITYSSGTYNFNLNAAGSTTSSPSNTGGAITNCIVSPTLPTGLSINTTTCAISGTPTVVSAAADYTVTPSNAIGSGTAQVVNITIANIAPSIAYSSSTYTFNLNAAGSTTGAPTNTGGSITSCTISPALPAGLSINTTTCAVSGTPSVVVTADYTVTPSNAIGSGTARVINIAIASTAPSIAYSSSTYSFNLNAAGSTTGTPTNTGGAITSCTVSPTLPTGLSINTTTCAVSGTPTVVTAAADYTVTPSNTLGTGAARVLNITIANIAPAIAYSSSSYAFTWNDASSTTGTPTNTGGAINSCTVSPTLPTGLSINSSTCVISGTPSATLSSSAFVVTATNAVGSASVGLTLSVAATTPLLSYVGSFGTSGTLGIAMSVTPTTLDTNGAALSSCSISPTLSAGLSINNSTCVISGTPSAVSIATIYTVTATNSAGSSNASVTLTVAANSPAISFSGATGTSGTAGVAMSITPTTLDDRGAAISSCTTTTALPSGLTINNSTCVISGTPSVSLPSTAFTVTATNSVGSTTATVTLVIAANTPVLSYAGSAGTSGSLGVAMSVTPTTLNIRGAAISSCTSATALPAGLTINNSTCVISGTPSVVSASASYSITAANSAGNSTPYSLTLEVANVAPSIAYSSATYSFNLNAASSTTGTPTNSGGDITNCVVSPTLPTGLSINTTNCAISGTPTAVTAAANYTVTPSNAIGSGTARVINISIANIAPSIAYSSGTYSFNLYDAGSTSGAPTNTGGAITNCVVSPALPAGLSISTTTCAVSGTPAVVTAAADYTVTPSNAIGSGTARVINISIANIVPSIAYSSATYSFNLNAAASTTGTPTSTGGAITNCAVSPTLPTGLSINTTTCEVSGTPIAVTAAANYTVTPSNTIGSGTARVINLTIANIVPSIAYSSATYSFNLNAAGSTTGTPTSTGGAITNCVVSPTLPTGLSISTSTCAISGTPTAITAAANYTVTPSNTIGSGTPRIINLAVSNGVPSISYSSSTYSFNMGAAGSTTSAPANSGGVITGCTITPALPSGLSISTTTCAISGTPSIGKLATDYTIVPSNAVGSGTARVINLTVVGITIVINSAPAVGPSGVSACYSFAQGIPTGGCTSVGTSVTTQASSVLSGTQIQTSIGTEACDAVGGGSYTRYSKNGTLISSTPDSITYSEATSYLYWSLTAGIGDTITFDFGCNLIAPSVTYPSASYSYPLGDSGISTNAVNTGGPAASCSVSPALPAGLTVGGFNCDVTGTPTTPTSAQNYTITATNSIGSSASQTISISVPNVPTINYSSFTYNLIQNTAGTTGVPTSTGAAITNCAVSPALVAGLSLSQTTCEISGTPTVVNTRQYLVTPSNANGSGTTRYVTLNVREPLPVITYPSSTYNYTIATGAVSIIPTSTGGSISSCSVTPALPGGLSINSSNCTISGNISANPSSATYTVSAVNGTGTTTRTITINIANLAPFITFTSASYSFTRNVPGSTGNSSIAGGGLITNCRVSPALPAGLSLSFASNYCGISGTPTALSPAANYSVTASNELGDGNTRILSIEVKALTVYTINTWACDGSVQTTYSNCSTYASGCYAYTNSGFTTPVTPGELYCDSSDGLGTCWRDTNSDAIMDNNYYNCGGD